jgi:hypothetical protein
LKSIRVATSGAFAVGRNLISWVALAQWPVKLIGGSVFLALAAFVLAQLARDTPVVG